MSGSASPEILFEIFISILPLYAVYLGWMIYTSQRAFKIRNSVLIPTHRYQALWVGASAVYWIVSISFYLLVPFLNILFPIQMLAAKDLIAITGMATLYFGLGLSIAWTDAIVPIARNSDPRNRDTLHWNYSRVVLWAIFVIGFALTTFFVIPPILANGGIGFFGPVGLAIQFYAQVSPFFFLIGSIICVVLVIAYIRSPDVSLRKHLKWLTAYTLVLVIQSLFIFLERSNFSSLLGNTPLGFSVIVAIFASLLIFDYVEALCLYECAKSLAPINRFPSEPLVDSRL